MITNVLFHVLKDRIQGHHRPQTKPPQNLLITMIKTIVTKGYFIYVNLYFVNVNKLFPVLKDRVQSHHRPQGPCPKSPRHGPQSPRLSHCQEERAHGNAGRRCW